MPGKYTQEERDRIDSDRANLQVAVERAVEKAQFLDECHVAVPALKGLMSTMLQGMTEDSPQILLAFALSNGGAANIIEANVSIAYMVGFEMGKANHELYKHPCHEITADHQHGVFTEGE